MFNQSQVYQMFLDSIKRLTQDDLNKLIQQARQLGISDVQINQGINALNALKTNI